MLGIKKRLIDYIYMTLGGSFYSNHLSQYLFEGMKVIDDVGERMLNYFDEFIIYKVSEAVYLINEEVTK